MRKDSLSHLWESESARITPQRDPSDFSDIIYILQDYIAKLIEKIFNAGKSLPASDITARVVIIGIAAIVAVAIIFVLWRRFGMRARQKLSQIISRRTGDTLFVEYSTLVSGGEYTRALRLFVRETADTLHLQHRTFTELFYANTNAVLSGIRIVYGRAIHLGSDISKTDLTSFEDQAVRIYPAFKRLSSKRKGGKS